jgi:hypothetical protein
MAGETELPGTSLAPACKVRVATPHRLVSLTTKPLANE